MFILLIFIIVQSRRVRVEVQSEAQQDNNFLMGKNQVTSFFPGSGFADLNYTSAKIKFQSRTESLRQYQAIESCKGEITYTINQFKSYIKQSSKYSYETSEIQLRFENDIYVCTIELIVEITDLSLIDDFIYYSVEYTSAGVKILENITYYNTIEEIQEAENTALRAAIDDATKKARSVRFEFSSYDFDVVGIRNIVINEQADDQSNKSTGSQKQASLSDISEYGSGAPAPTAGAPAPTAGAPAPSPYWGKPAEGKPADKPAEGKPAETNQYNKIVSIPKHHIRVDIELGVKFY